MVEALTNTGINLPKAIANALSKAGKATGASFQFLLETAKRESSLQPDAAASTSSARGLFQFIESTWLQMVKEEGAQFGLERYADHIEKTAKGRYVVRDSEMRDDILKLRNDPEIAALMAGAFARNNADRLAGALGRDPTEGEVYLSHVFGAGGATKLIKLAQTNPDARADRYFSEQAKANKGLFYTRSGQPRSLEQLIDRVTAGYSTEPMNLDPGRQVSIASSSSLPSYDDSQPEAFETASNILGKAFAFQSVDTMFQGLYTDSNSALAAASSFSGPASEWKGFSLNSPSITGNTKIAPGAVGMPLHLSKYLKGETQFFKARELAPPA
jgi:hypothetical protein